MAAEPEVATYGEIDFFHHACYCVEIYYSNNTTEFGVGFRSAIDAISRQTT
jgi:hypothetical protein